MAVGLEESSPMVGAKRNYFYSPWTKKLRRFRQTKTQEKGAHLYKRKEEGFDAVLKGFMVLRYASQDSAVDRR